MYLARMHIDRIADNMCMSGSTRSKYFFIIQKTLAHFTHREALNCRFLGTINTGGYRVTQPLLFYDQITRLGFCFLKMFKTLVHSIGRDLSIPGVLLAAVTYITS